MQRHRHRPDRRSFGEVLLHTSLGVATGTALAVLCFLGLAVLMGAYGSSGAHPLLGPSLAMIPFVHMIPAGALAGGIGINWWMARENRRRRTGRAPLRRVDR